ncbi:lectin [Falsiroseomonas bella]|uniref:Lectin n=1 Tax=Falsiroseomonas bella TaxID=2184016 RepID=A0A317FLJ0_9PROT|nr:lectin [Falsiroseomonas bella]PWS38428.1 lectin [Falsiroseomonas bella]
MRNSVKALLAGGCLLAALPAADAQSPAPDPAAMTFFVTSTGIGRGADLGGLAGADAHCQALAQAAGAGNRTWRAYLSTQGQGAVNARDRIGNGPWQNARGVVIARSVADLHSPANAMTKQTNVNERGQVVNGRGDTPNEHDVLTGSQADGTAFAAGQDRTCRNWTYSGGEGSAMVGHHDRIGLDESDAAKSWNTSHPSRGCSQDNLRSSGGAGLFYCFAVN